MGREHQHVKLTSYGLDFTILVGYNKCRINKRGNNISDLFSFDILMYKTVKGMYISIFFVLDIKS